ncbi:hypothetical protein AB1Y20_013898 [Prymnesium parvum]|uniref:Uncharacterized protein n=1 Tax=Prymnesium parvum TaxID=97485 RepID=A0AB34IHP2_PRYPA
MATGDSAVPHAPHSPHAEVLSSASRVLPAELDRLPPPALAELAASLGCDEASLQHFLTESCAPGLLHPPGDALPKLDERSSAEEVRMLAELYWRCSVALVQMPEGALASLARHHVDLAPFLASPEASAPERRMALVRAVLPRFAMVCTTREEAEEAERRKAEIKKLKEEAAREEEVGSAAAQTPPPQEATEPAPRSARPTGPAPRPSSPESGVLV